MALRRKSRPVAPGIPAELLDRADPAWASRESAAAWAAREGVDLPPMSHGPLSRHRAAVHAWAVAEGITVTHGRSPRPSADVHALREMGIPEMSLISEYKARFFTNVKRWTR